MAALSSHLLLVLSAVFWGGTFVAGRQLAPLIDPYSAAFLRFALASLLLTAWMYRRLGRFPPITRVQLATVCLLGCTGIFAYNLFFFAGLRTVEAGRASLIVALNPVLIALASVCLFNERLSLQRVTGVVLSVFGALLVIGRGDLPGLLRGSIGPGELLLLGCVVSWTLYTLIGKRLLHNVSALVAVTYSSLIGTFLLGLTMVWHAGISQAGLGNIEVWFNITYLAVFGTLFAFVWYYKGVHALGAARAAQYINLVPVSGVCFGALLLGEPVTVSLLTGGLLVIAGLWLTNSGATPPDAAEN